MSVILHFLFLSVLNVLTTTTTTRASNQQQQPQQQQQQLSHIDIHQFLWLSIHTLGNPPKRVPAMGKVFVIDELRFFGTPNSQDCQFALSHIYEIGSGVIIL